MSDQSTFKPDGKCPLCGTPWEAGASESGDRCHHEAGWYRDWLAEATELIGALLQGDRSEP